MQASSDIFIYLLPKAETYTFKMGWKQSWMRSYKTQTMLEFKEF